MFSDIILKRNSEKARKYRDSGEYDKALEIYLRLIGKIMIY
ncbi:hypothetical protein [Methanobrevibacter arboriphilus]|nr:hypothetical protein [Methanobrevibacter arboriphilus]